MDLWRKGEGTEENVSLVKDLIETEPGDQIHILELPFNFTS